MKTLHLYHGSTKVIERPVLGIGNPKNDYGIGFYCTENTRAHIRHAMNRNSDGVITFMP